MRECSPMAELPRTMLSRILVPPPIRAFFPMLTFGPARENKEESVLKQDAQVKDCKSKNCNTVPGRVGKTRIFFFFKPSPVVFLGLFGFLGFFWGFLFFFCPEERVLGFFSVSRIGTFRCIQTLNYNHSY